MHNMSKDNGSLVMKISGNVGNGTTKNRVNFGDDPFFFYAEAD